MANLTINQIPKATSPTNCQDSSISDDGTTVTVNENLSMLGNSIQFTDGGTATISTDADGGINLTDQGGKTLQWNSWDDNGLQLNGANLVMNNASGSGGANIYLDGATLIAGGPITASSFTGDGGGLTAVQLSNINAGGTGAVFGDGTTTIMDADITSNGSGGLTAVALSLGGAALGSNQFVSTNVEIDATGNLTAQSIIAATSATTKLNADGSVQAAGGDFLVDTTGNLTCATAAVTGNINCGGVLPANGFTGTGAYVTFVIQNGIILSAS